MAGQVEPSERLEQPHGDPAEAGSPRRLGDFTLLRRLGKGSQGEVWEARQESLGRLVALKLLPPQMLFDAEPLQRFRREAEAGGRLSHQGIVTVYAIGEHDGVHYIAQELVAGGRTLEDVIAEARRLSELPADWNTRMAALFSAVAEALHAAHGVGVIHRDVKPGNILITEDGRPKLADFGLARVQDELALSCTGDLAGTPFYMSPEQVRGERTELDHRTDIFSLGSSLYEALTLARPFTGDRQQILRSIAERDPPDPRRVHRHVPRDLAVITLKALEKQPAKRFASAGDFAADLRRFLAGEPIAARPPGPAVRAAKWAHRHPQISAGGSVAAIAFAAVIWLWKDNQADKLVAQQAAQDIATSLASERLAGERMEAALHEAEAERERARTESATSERMVSLLEEVFSGADPFALTTEESVQPAHVLDRGASLLRLLDDQPVAQWRLMQRLGRGYRNVGMLEEARLQLDHALAIASRIFGERDGRTASSRLELARVLHLTGDRAEAEVLASAALEELTAIHGADAIETLAAVGELGLLYKDSGRIAEAESRLREYHDGCVRLDEDGGTGTHTVLACHALGQFLLEQGRLDEAAQYLRPAYQHLSLLPEYFGLLLGHSFAYLNDKQGRQAAESRRLVEAQRFDVDAERVYRSVLQRQRELLGDDTHETLTTLSNLGNFYRHRGREELARPLLEEALSSLERLDGALAGSTLFARNNLARLEYDVGNKLLAEALWQSILQADLQVPQPDARPVLAALSNLASLARDDGRLELAEGWAQECVERSPADEPELAARSAKLAGIRQLLAEQQRAARTRP